MAISAQHDDNAVFELRKSRSADDLWPMLETLYGKHPDYQTSLKKLERALKSNWTARPADLKLLDLKRDLEPDWFQRPNMVGYVFYIDLFAGRLTDILDKLDYLESLGVTYVHLMPCLKPRKGESDGGYSVADYRKINPDFGSMEDLETVSAAFRARGISVCVDLVLNHTAKEHAWAKKARKGDPVFQDYYLMFETDETPRAYEQDLLEIFPDTAPGSFTHYEDMQKWVWTTFNEHQWDLNWANPQVFVEIVNVMLFLANKGVDVLRLDAVAFMWKRMGTRCQSEPEVHMILRALRACCRIVAPSVLHLEEAIVGPAEMLGYFGREEHDGKEGNLAYHNNLMVQYWNSLATRSTRLMTHVLRTHFPETLTNATYATYIRCHDDIGWAIDDADAAALGFSGYMHRNYLSEFYEGSFTGSFARGGLFGVNEETGDKRNVGSFASLAGVEAAQEANDAEALDLAIERMLMGNALMASFGGIPLIYMGDELGLTNDYDYIKNPDHSADSRWMHRPKMNWERVTSATDTQTVEGRILANTREIYRKRKAIRGFHGAVPTRILDSGNDAVFAFARMAPTGAILCLFNFSENAQHIPEGTLEQTSPRNMRDLLTDTPITLHENALVLPPYGRVWLD